MRRNWSARVTAALIVLVAFVAAIAWDGGCARRTLVDAPRPASVAAKAPAAERCLARPLSIAAARLVAVSASKGAVALPADGAELAAPTPFAERRSRLSPPASSPRPQTKAVLRI